MSEPEYNPEPSEFGGGPLYGCPECMILTWIEYSEGDECPACGFDGGFDTIHIHATEIIQA